MSTITTHVLDTARGRPAAGLRVRLERMTGAAWSTLAERVTDADGRVRDLLPTGIPASAGRYRLSFDTGGYHAAAGVAVFYPEVQITFEFDAATHHHVPLLLSPFGYTTYRGS